MGKAIMSFFLDHQRQNQKLNKLNSICQPCQVPSSACHKERLTLSGGPLAPPMRISALQNMH